MRETPTITASAYTTTTYSPVMDSGGALLKAVDIPANWHDPASPDEIRKLAKLFDNNVAAQAATIAYSEEVNMGARIVKVFIADTDENIPLEKRVLYSGTEKLTDLTDQELFFEVPIANLLDAHNKMRATTIDKKQSDKFGRDIKLEPARIRDLKMVVVTVAQF